MSLPPRFIDAKKKEVVFHIKGGHPVTMSIPTWIKSFPDEYKSIGIISIPAMKPNSIEIQS